MRNRRFSRRLFAVLMVFVMMVGLLPTASLADDGTNNPPAVVLGQEARAGSALQEAPPVDPPANSPPAVVPGQEIQTGLAAPASEDGAIPAVPYTASPGGWFLDPDNDPLTYSVVSATYGTEDVSADVSISEGTLTYTPAPAQAGSTVTIEVRASDGTADSTGSVTVTVAVSSVSIAAGPEQEEVPPQLAEAEEPGEPAGPDLSVNSLEVPGDLEAGREVTVTATVYFASETEVEASFQVRLYVGSAELPAASQEVTLPAGGGQAVGLSWTPPASGAYTLRVEIGNASVTDADPSNNGREIVVEVGEAAGSPDLAVDSLRLEPESPRAGETVTVTAAVYNLGAGASGSFQAALYEGESSEPVDEREVDSIDPGGKAEVSFAWGAAEAGEYTLRVVADSGEAVAEADETNNQNSIEVTVRPPELSYVWTDVGGGLEELTGATKIRGIWGSAADDIYAVSESNASYGMIYHYDGTGWEVYYDSFAEDEKFWEAYDEGEDYDPLIFGSYGIWGSSADTIYVAGNGTDYVDVDADEFLEYAAVYKYNPNLDKKWEPVLRNDDIRYFAGIWGSSATDIYAVGNESSVMYHYDGSAWSKVGGLPGGISFTGIWGSGPADIYAVGTGSNIYHYDGSAWSAMIAGIQSSVSLYAVWGSAAGDVYAAGYKSSNGLIYHYDGNAEKQWTEVKSTYGTQYNCVGGGSASNVVAGGQNGFVTSYDGGSWREDNIGSNIYSVWAIPGGGMYLGGERVPEVRQPGAGPLLRPGPGGDCGFGPAGLGL
jgi:hypothetical protein